MAIPSFLVCPYSRSGRTGLHEMNEIRRRCPYIFRGIVLSLVLSLVSPVATAQNVRQDANGRVVPQLSGVRLSPQEQIKLGHETEAEVYKQMPVLPDSNPVPAFVRRMGARLAEKAPGTRWPFEFHVIAQKEINAFALPGGPIFVNLGSIQAADEDELAGVMAHEISHVVMQHTARDAGKQQTTQTLGMLGALIAGVVLGNGIAGNLASGAIQLGAGAISMSYSRTDESEADLLGAQIMYDAGYNPYALAEFFQKLAHQGGSGGVQFLSDHPNPGNRAENIRKAIQRFPQKSYPRRDSPEFVAMKRVADSMQAYTAQQIAHHKGPWNLATAGSNSAVASPAMGAIETVSYEQVRPSGSWRQFRQGGLAFDYPANWELSKYQGGILVAPPAGVASNGAVAYGLSIHATKSGSGNSREVARELATDIVKSNPGMKILGGPNHLRVNGIEAVAYDLVGNSPVRASRDGKETLRERDWLVTMPREDGSSVALIFTAPDRDYAEMKQTFQTMLRSFRIQ